MMEEVRSEEKVVQRKKSFVVSTVEEHEASLDESKEWITNYLEGNQAQPDQFQKKYFDASSPSKTENVSQEELTKEIKAASEPSAAKIIETYEVVDNGPLPENIAAEISLGREASTKLKLEAKEEEDVDYTPKNISLPMDDLKKHEISNIAIQMTEKTNSGQLLSPSIEATSLPLSPIKEDASQNSNFKDYKTFAITGVSSAKLPTKQPIPDRKFSERPPSRKPSNNDLPFRMMNLKVKIYDLTPIRENHILKSDDEVRAHFIKTIETQRALIMKGSGEAKNPPKPQKIIIFDWDDTMFPTSFLSSLNFSRTGVLGDKEKLLFKKVDETASALLKISCEFASPYIITNAAKGWVEYSSRLFMPLSHKVLKMKKVTIISARSNYENLYPLDTTKWKMEAFTEIGRQYSPKAHTNIICLGDSEIEMDAAKLLGK